MIYNYLEWVKREREYHGSTAVQNRRLSHTVASDWCKGFYAGNAVSHYYSACRLRRLQKDIEERANPDKYGNSWGIVDIRTGDRLSD